MSHITLRGTGSPQAVASRLREGVLGSAISCELIQSVRRDAGGAQVYIMVFDKYYMRSSNRASLTVVLTAAEGAITADLIGAGGGSDALFNFSWGAEGDFAETAAGILRSIGFR